MLYFCPYVLNEHPDYFLIIVQCDHIILHVILPFPITEFFKLLIYCVETILVVGRLAILVVGNLTAKWGKSRGDQNVTVSDKTALREDVRVKPLLYAEYQPRWKQQYVELSAETELPHAQCFLSNLKYNPTLSNVCCGRVMNSLTIDFSRRLGDIDYNRSESDGLA